MRVPRLIPAALLGAFACSVYSESLLQNEAPATVDGGDMPDSGAPDGSAGGSSGSSGSGSGGGGNGGSGGTAPGDAGADVPDASGDGGCVGAGGTTAVDCCPTDDDKTEPGVCGCGVADTDGDGDGVPDCMDGCPADGDKTEPGGCGCGHSEASCDELKVALVHRYSFDGSGTEATDSVGMAHGTIVGGTLANGVVDLEGLTTDQHVDLPDGLVSGLTDATFEIWSTWRGGSEWQRLFDFGDQTGSMNGRSYLFLTPVSNGGVARAVFRKPSTAEVIASDTALFPANVPSHAAVVVDDTNDTLSLYVQGVLRATTTLTDSLSSINDVNNWLGKSNYAVDPNFSGTITEFRIYEAALTETQIALSHELGPDPAFLAE